MSTDDADLELAEEDAIAMLPPCERETLRHSVDPEELEGWEETTQVDEPWSASTKDGPGGMGLALPAPFLDDGDDDDELTDFALTIEPMSSRPARRNLTPPLRPQEPVPRALAFRAKIGTTPPVRRLPPALPAITWRPSVSAETSATTIEAPRAQREWLQEPVLVPIPTPAPLPQSVLPLPRSRLRSWAIAAATMALGAGAAAFVATLEGDPEPPAVSASVVSVPIYIPIAIPAETASETAAETAAETARRPPSEPPQASAGHFEEGMSALAANQLEAAAHALRRALRSDPRKDEAILALGLVSERRGDTQRALYWYRRYLRRVPEGVRSASVRQRIEILSGRTR